ncbi:alpha/beta hydrolase [Leifsonia sp. F6_8S_P_1B]|uniref:Alpha/beta hydrolase n=1 Tax=Leifsonia williamsii TaxID=3035919 RepID=A0ABT8K724_9MICO|nr:alpha/beta hydrolase [Leifsonia williamsii]MDN4613250.1 alpha/beta hydrolase [Leifsonia williamsii]
MDELPRRPLLSRRAQRLVNAGAIAVASVLVVAGVVRATPWPSALLIRSVFEKGAAETVAELERHTPSSGVEVRSGIRYAPGSPDTTLDAVWPTGADEPLPVVVWVHGGAWISGASADVTPYLRILASHGYAGVALNYTYGPEGEYPLAVRQLNDALGYVREHAGELHVDPTRIVLAGDSAGSQLASQLALLTTDPDYAHLMGIRPALEADQLVATVLNCGVYDMDALADLTGIGAWGFQTALWSYTGTKAWSQTFVGNTMSTIDHVTPAFPPTFITGGNGDALTWMESIPMARALKAQGVEVDQLFWPADHEPALPHEYQFKLDSPEAQEALQRTLDFLAAHTS